jgi:hypothetical protein
MSVLNQFWDFITGTNKEGPDATPSVIPYSYTQLYDALYDLYNNDSEVVADDTTRRLRTVVNRSVEFFAAKMLPGRKIEVMATKGEGDAETENKPLKEAIEQIIKDSNLGNNKPAMLRGFSLYGDSFVRVRGDDQKSYLEDVSPFFVTDFGEDSRGFLTYIRIDIPIIDNSDVEAQQGTPALYTEYWDNDEKVYRSWVTLRTATTSIKQLGTPKEEIKFSELGIDFIPIVHTKFRDIGDARGLSCVYHALDKIYEANRIATRLHDLLFAFGEPIFVASANDKDAAGRPLPPPAIKTESTTTGVLGGVVESVKVLFGRLVSLPGMATLNSLIPDIDYQDALAILNAQMEEIEKDLPELRWYSLTPDAQLSGTAMRTLLGAAIDRANEARNNFLSSLSRMMEMALTIGQFNGIFDQSLGTFDNGDFDHQLIVDDSWGESTEEKGTTMATLTGAGVPAPVAMKMAGFSDELVKEAFPQGLQPLQTAPQTPRTPPGTILRNVNGKTAIQVG